MPRIDPDDFINLKAAVKAEMLRRQYQDSLAAYGGTDYDYAHTPAEGQPVYEEHYTKNAVPLQAANSEQVPDAGMPRPVSKTDLDEMTAFVTILSARTNLYNKTATDCNGNCAGACYATCSTSCDTSCTGTCTGGCQGCSGTCSTGCYGCSGCGNTCQYDCTGTCDYSCRNGCQGCRSCTGTCEGSCQTACSLACGYTCSGVNRDT